MKISNLITYLSKEIPALETHVSEKAKFNRGHSDETMTLAAAAYDLTQIIRLKNWMTDVDIDVDGDRKGKFFLLCEKRIPETVSNTDFNGMVLTAIDWVSRIPSLCELEFISFHSKQ